MQQIKPIKYYDFMLSQLKGNRRYQLRLSSLLLDNWLLSGLNEGLFQLAIARNISSALFFFRAEHADRCVAYRYLYLLLLSEDCGQCGVADSYVAWAVLMAIC